VPFPLLPVTNGRAFLQLIRNNYRPSEYTLERVERSRNWMTSHDYAIFVKKPNWSGAPKIFPDWSPRVFLSPTTSTIISCTSHFITPSVQSDPASSGRRSTIRRLFCFLKGSVFVHTTVRGGKTRLIRKGEPLRSSFLIWRLSYARQEKRTCPLYLKFLIERSRPALPHLTVSLKLSMIGCTQHIPGGRIFILFFLSLLVCLTWSTR
jgi:hypothetical protein